jgi:hypoxanthine-guanine phosphoribosyltransferase
LCLPNSNTRAENDVVRDKEQVIEKIVLVVEDIMEIASAKKIKDLFKLIKELRSFKKIMEFLKSVQ